MSGEKKLTTKPDGARKESFYDVATFISFISCTTISMHILGTCLKHTLMKPTTPWTLLDFFNYALPLGTAAKQGFAKNPLAKGSFSACLRIGR